MDAEIGKSCKLPKIFYYEDKAKMLVIGEKFIVLGGSTMFNGETLKADISCETPGEASEIVIGKNDWTIWKTTDGKKLEIYFA